MYPGATGKTGGVDSIFCVDWIVLWGGSRRHGPRSGRWEADGLPVEDGGDELCIEGLILED